MPAFLLAQRQADIKRLLAARDTEQRGEAEQAQNAEQAENTCQVSDAGQAADAERDEFAGIGRPYKKILLLSAECGAAQEALNKLEKFSAAGNAAVPGMSDKIWIAGDAKDPKTYEELGADSVVVLVVPFGKGTGCRTENLLGQVRQAGAQAAGILLTQADARFLRRYYQVMKEDR